VTTPITLLEAPADEGELVAAVGAAELYRALREDVEFRFVAIGRVPGDLPATAYGGDYEAIYHDGRTLTGGVTLVDPFAVPEEHDEEFLRLWRAQHEALAQHRGYLGTRLYRDDDAARFRHIEIARWSSPLMVARATARTQRLPALYVPVLSGSS